LSYLSDFFVGARHREIVTRIRLNYYGRK
jgi:hypothetical protein